MGISCELDRIIDFKDLGLCGNLGGRNLVESK